MDGATDSFFGFFHALFVSPLFLRAVRALGVAIVFEGLTFALSRYTDKMLAPAFRLDQAEESGWRVYRRKVLQTLPKRLLRAGLYSVAGLMILGIFGVGTAGTIIPVAAILGALLAVGLRGVLADAARGYVIFLEHWYAPGHRAVVNDIEGTIATVTLTATVVRLDNGDTVRIPNSAVLRVVDRGRAPVAKPPAEAAPPLDASPGD